MKTTTDKLFILGLRNTPVILFVAVFVIFGLLSPRFFQYANFENIIKQASYAGIIAVGMTFVLLTAGIDLSVGSNMYLSAIVAGLLIKTYHIPVWCALLVCLLVGLAFGAVNAFAITKLRIIPFVVTLSTLFGGRGLALLFTKSRPVPFPETVIKIGSIRLFGVVPMPIVIFVCVVICAHVFLRRTQIGRQIYAVGNDIEAAKKAGINTDRVRAVAYIVCGLLAALGGFVSVAQLGIVNASFGEGYEFEAITAAVLGGASLFGGIGNVFPGTVLGTILIQMICAGLVYTQVDLYIQPLVEGTIIFLAVLLDSFRNTQLVKLSRRHIRGQLHLNSEDSK
jgi:ribose transport system permease protein